MMVAAARASGLPQAEAGEAPAKHGYAAVSERTVRQWEAEGWFVELVAGFSAQANQIAVGRALEDSLERKGNRLAALQGAYAACLVDIEAVADPSERVKLRNAAAKLLQQISCELGEYGEVPTGQTDADTPVWGVYDLDAMREEDGGGASA